MKMELPSLRTALDLHNWTWQTAWFLIGALGWECCLATAGAEPAIEEVRVLFLGNSLTRRQDMPFLLEQVARSKGKRLVADYSPSRDGYKLQMHANAPRTLEAIRSRPWDYVVLQEHGSVPILNPAASRRAVASLHEVIRSTGAQTILYEHSRSGDTNGTARAECQRQLSVVFEQIATDFNLRVAPIGPAFVEACGQDPSVRLFEKDHVHPAPEGAYLAACVLYATIFHETPEGTSSQRLRSPEGTVVIDLKAVGKKARLLERAAWSAVQKYQHRVLSPRDTPARGSNAARTERTAN